MSAPDAIPVTVEPEAAALVAQLGLQVELEQMLDHAKRTITGLQCLNVKFSPAYDTGEEGIEIQAIRDPPSPDINNWRWDQFSKWKITTFSPDVCRYIALLDEFGTNITPEQELAIVARQLQELKARRDRRLADGAADVFQLHVEVAGIEKMNARLQAELDAIESTKRAKNGGVRDEHAASNRRSCHKESAMRTTDTIPVTVEPEAAAFVAELGMQAELDQMLDHAKRTITGLQALNFQFMPAYDTGEERIILQALRDPASPDFGAWRWDQWSHWEISTFSPDVYRHFTLSDELWTHYGG
jgi:hypothetical protein